MSSFLSSLLTHALPDPAAAVRPPTETVRATATATTTTTATTESNKPVLVLNERLQRLLLAGLRQEDSDTSCPISREPFEVGQMTVTSCGHVFDTLAFNSWMSHEQRTRWDGQLKCPVCRAHLE